MYSGPIDLAKLLDPQQLIAAGSLPYTFLAFHRDNVDESGMPTDQLVQDTLLAFKRTPSRSGSESRRSGKTRLTPLLNRKASGPCRK